MVNINIKIPEEVHKKIKVKAVLDDSTLKDQVITILNKKFSNKKKS